MREVILAQPLLMTGRKNFLQYVRGTDLEDIFNIDETGLFFCETTNKSFHTKGQDCAGGNNPRRDLL